MAEVSVEAFVAERRHSWRRPPVWPDGRLFNSNEDRMTRVGLRVAFLLLVLYTWAIGRSERFDVFEAFDITVGDSWWILAVGLLAMSALCLFAARRRVWVRATRTSAGTSQPGTVNWRLPAWGRTPRWPDGRLFATRDPLVTVSTLVSMFAAGAALWLLGEAGVPRIDIATYEEPLVLLLQLATIVFIWVVGIRMHVVQAVVEGWMDDKELGFVERRIVALAADAKRAKARFAPSPNAGGPAVQGGAISPGSEMPDGDRGRH